MGLVIFFLKLLLAGLLLSFFHWIAGYEQPETRFGASIALIAVALIFEEIYRIRKSLERIAESGMKLPENVKLNHLNLNVVMKKPEANND